MRIVLNLVLGIFVMRKYQKRKGNTRADFLDKLIYEGKGTHGSIFSNLQLFNVIHQMHEH